MIKTVEWTDEGVRMIDQRILPTEEKYLMLRSYEEVAEAIKKMVVRGAPAIGVSAAMGLQTASSSRRASPPSASPTTPSGAPPLSSARSAWPWWSALCSPCPWQSR